MNNSPQKQDRPSILADFSDLCGECPVWDTESRSLYWTDCVGLKFYRYDWDSGQSSILSENIEIYGFRRNRAGGFVVTNTSGAWLWDGRDTLDPIVSRIGASTCPLNDCIADSTGRLLAGSFFYNPSSAYKLGQLIRIDRSGHATVLDEGYHLINGLGLTPDERTLYVTDTVARLIYAYDYDPASGSVGKRRIFVQVPANEGIPDGLTVDGEGFVWSAQWYGGCVVRYDMDGKVERRLALPAKQTSSVAFGGPDLTDLLVTSAAQSETLPVMPRDYDPTTGPVGGPLYHFRLDIVGQKQPMADIRIRD